MGVFGAARRNDGVEEHLEGHHRPHYQEHQGHHECSNQSFSVRVNPTRLIGLPVPLMSSPSCPLFFQYLLLHPSPCHPPPLHLLLPSRVLFSTRTVLALIVVLTLTSMSRGITNVRSYSFVRLCNLIESLCVSSIVWVKFFGKGKVGRLYLSFWGIFWQPKFCTVSFWAETFYGKEADWPRAIFWKNKARWREGVKVPPGLSPAGWLTGSRVLE